MSNTGQGSPLLATATTTGTTTLSEPETMESSSSSLSAWTTYSPHHQQQRTERNHTVRIARTPTSLLPNRTDDRNTVQDESSHYSLLPALWAGDVAVALVVTAAAAPFLTIVDKAIVQQSAATASLTTTKAATCTTATAAKNVLLASMRHTAASILRHPVAYYRSPTFGWMWLAYAATYTTANLCKTYQETTDERQLRSMTSDKATATSHGKNKKSSSSSNAMLVAGTTAVNSAASLVKDRAYARLFGQAVRPVPLPAYAAWMARDATVIASSFVLPARVTPVVQEATGWSPSASAAVAQLVTPVAMQVVAGPAHLWGLTLYNTAGSSSSSLFRQRWQAFRQGLVSVTAARMLRILPGYGVAGVANQRGRAWYKNKLLEAQVLRANNIGNTNNKCNGAAATTTTSSMVALIRTAAVAAGSSGGGR